MTKCVECGSADVTISLQVDRGSGLVRFRVDCAVCGGFSHYLEHDERNRAVRDYLLTAVQYALHADSDQGPTILTPKELQSQFPEYALWARKVLIGDSRRFNDTVVYKLRSATT